MILNLLHLIHKYSLQMVSFLVFLFHLLYLHNYSLLVLLFVLFSLLLGLLLHKLALYLLFVVILLCFPYHHSYFLFGWSIKSLVKPYLYLLFYSLPSLVYLSYHLHHIYLLIYSNNLLHFHLKHIALLVLLM